MQKKLLGMAVAAALAMPAVALAQSAVQVYGTVHMSVNQAKYTKDTAGTLNDTTKYGVTSHASNWGLRSTETLGGGLTAWLQAEFNLKMTRDNGVHDGEGTAPRPPPRDQGGRGGEEREQETVIALLLHPTTVLEEARMLSELIGTLLTPSRVAHAHCDRVRPGGEPVETELEAGVEPIVGAAATFGGRLRYHATVRAIPSANP